MQNRSSNLSRSLSIQLLNDFIGMTVFIYNIGKVIDVKVM